MTILAIYLRKNIIFIPTTCKTTAGFYWDQEPVKITNSDNRHQIINYITNMILQGNPVISALKSSEYPDPVLLKNVNVKTWSQFAKHAYGWVVEYNNNTCIVAQQRKANTGGWEDDPDATKVFPEGASIDEVAEYIADQIQLFAKK